jgi:threonine/homoserine/homoserine lactone efflux protein
MIDALLKGFAIGVLLMFAVGPVLFAIIKQSINHGKKGGFSFAAGVWISDILWIVLSNGFSELVKELLNFKRPIGIAGSGFLIAMGIYYLFFKKEVKKEDRQVAIAGDVITAKGKRTNYVAILSSGFILNTLNPAVMTFWVIVAASLSTVYTLNERVIIFITCMVVNVLADSGKIFGAGRLGAKLSDKNILRINKISGLLYLLFGVAVIIGMFYYYSK